MDHAENFNHASHFSPVTTQSLMRDVLIALTPAIIVALLMFGIGALKVLLTSVAACVMFEYLITRYLLKTANTIRDCSAMITGVLLAFNLPSSMPAWMILVGAFVAIGITKMAFGGLGKIFSILHWPDVSFCLFPFPYK